MNKTITITVTLTEKQYKQLSDKLAYEDHDVCTWLDQAVVYALADLDIDYAPTEAKETSEE